MKREKKNEEWVGNLREELEEIKNMEIEVEGIEAYVTFSLGCANFFTVACC